jgi:hypothetical protein
MLSPLLNAQIATLSLRPTARSLVRYDDRDAREPSG